MFLASKNVTMLNGLQEKCYLQTFEITYRVFFDFIFIKIKQRKIMSNNISEYPLVKTIELKVTNRGKGVNYGQNITTYNDFIYELSCPNPSHQANNTTEHAGFQLRKYLDKAISQNQTSTSFNIDCNGDETPPTDDIPAMPCSNTIKVDVAVEYK